MSKTFTELMAAERRDDNGQSNGRLFEALTRWVMSTQAPWANQFAHVRFTPPNNPGCDLWAYRRSDFSKVDVECKDYFDRTLHLEQVRGLATQHRGGRDKILATSASRISSRVEEVCEEHHIELLDRAYFERLERTIGGFPSREEIMEFSEPPAPTEPIELLPHQAELSDALAEELRQSKKAWLGAPTQTGKTFTLMATIEKLDARRIAWGVPTRAIKDSVVTDLSRLQVPNLRIGVVGSEPGNGASEWLEDAEAIVRFMEHPDPFVIVYVIKSSPKLRDAVQATAPVDVNVIDEIHEMAGRAKQKWAALDIATTYRVGATATMAAVSEEDKEMCQDEGWKFSSMDNSGEHDYGKGVILSPAEARKRDLAVPAQLVLTQTWSSELVEWIANSPKLETMLQEETINGFDAQTALVLAKATDAMHARKSIFTLNTLNAARGLKRAMPLACEYLGLPHLKGYYVDGEMRQSNRQAVLWEFENDPNPAFLVQVRCIGLGIAIRGLDGVAFGQPRHAPISLIQTFGRAAGQAFGEGATPKTHYHVYIPVVVGASETPEEAIENSQFATIVEVLSGYNDDAADQLINNVQIVGRPGAKISQRPREPGADPVYAATPDEIKALQVLVQKAKMGVLEFRWQQGYQHLREYHEREGHANVPLNYVTDDGYRLGVWVMSQRMNEERLRGESA